MFWASDFGSWKGYKDTTCAWEGHQLACCYRALSEVRQVGGHLGGSVGWVPNFGSSHDLTVGGSEPFVGLCADSWEPGACFRFWGSLSLPLPHLHSVSSLSKVRRTLKIFVLGCLGGSVAQSVKRLTSARVVISWFVSPSPVSDSVLTAGSLEPAPDSVSLPLSLPLPYLYSVLLYQK